MQLSKTSDWLADSLPHLAIDKRGAAGRADEMRFANNLTAEQGAKPFSGVMERAIQAVEGPVKAAAGIVDRFARGTEGEVHESMMALEKSDIGLKFFVTAKNKLVDGYKELMRAG